jgi:hypothetical protein
MATLKRNNQYLFTLYEGIFRPAWQKNFAAEDKIRRLLGEKFSNSDPQWSSAAELSAPW